jgi:hypothetical protein
MKPYRKTNKDIKECIVELSNSLKDNSKDFEQGLVIGQIIAYSSILGIFIPVGINDITEILKWARETFK